MNVHWARACPALVWVFDGLDIAAAKNSSLESIPCIGHACADSILLSLWYP